MTYLELLNQEFSVIYWQISALVVLVFVGGIGIGSFIGWTSRKEKEQCP